ncbi:carbohydrate ABC transporter permease [Clostridium intestinale]|uniref:Multiple sugar transport system permease protein n=1 Tax=Clostridium intestinale DSM 6191 TaxID=1121320 RepID=A0A1M5YM04_9CLOT|nr:carbohydrate ABC transporter permease [Clostridium intestinale]SHI13105.1 multiple sugar transport system permease protein [Clostridium intestinale DSM 6191]
MFFNKYKEKSDGAIRYYDMKSLKTKILSITIFILCLLILIVCLFPSVWVFLASFKDISEFRKDATILPSTFNFQKYVDTWNNLKFVRYYINSTIVVIGGTLCSVTFNGLLAYVLAIIKPKGHKIILGLVMWSLLIPATTSIVALFVNINKVGLNGSFLPLWLVFGANAFYVILFKNFFEGLPKELIEAAKLDGCGELQIFLRVILPLSRPIVMVVVIFTVTAAWSDFLLPYLVLNGTQKETIMVKLFAYHSSNKVNAVDMLRAVAFSIIPPIILFTIFQKQITDGATAGAVKE